MAPLFFSVNLGKHVLKKQLLRTHSSSHVKSLITLIKILAAQGLLTLKQGDNALGSVCLSVRPSVCLVESTNSNKDHYQSMVFVCL